MQWKWERVTHYTFIDITSHEKPVTCAHHYRKRCAQTWRKCITNRITVKLFMEISFLRIHVYDVFGRLSAPTFTGEYWITDDEMKAGIFQSLLLFKFKCLVFGRWTTQRKCMAAAAKLSSQLCTGTMHPHANRNVMQELGDANVNLELKKRRRIELKMTC